MFADALLDSHHLSRRGWATLTSFGIQAIAVAFLLAIPMFYTQVLPQMRVTPHLIASLGDNAPQPSASRQAVRGEPSIYTELRINVLTAPRSVLLVTSTGPDIEAPNLPIGSADASRIGPGSPVGVFHSLDQVAVRVTPPPPVAAKTPRISVMMEGSLIHRVDPVYPSLARAARVQGTVMLAAVIGRDGSVQNLQLLSGHPLLTTSAIDAVRQWRYRPYVLNGSPIEVDTQITVKFILAH